MSNFEEIKNYKKKFSITQLREFALKYNSFPKESDKNLVGNNAIREFLLWVEQNKTIEEPKTKAGK